MHLTTCFWPILILHFIIVKDLFCLPKHWFTFLFMMMTFIGIKAKQKLASSPTYKMFLANYNLSVACINIGSRPFLWWWPLLASRRSRNLRITYTTRLFNFHVFPIPWFRYFKNGRLLGGRSYRNIRNSLLSDLLPMLRRSWRGGKMQETAARETMMHWICKKLWTKN